VYRGAEKTGDDDVNWVGRLTTLGPAAEDVVAVRTGAAEEEVKVVGRTVEDV